MENIENTFAPTQRMILINCVSTLHLMKYVQMPGHALRFGVGHLQRYTYLILEETITVTVLLQISNPEWSKKLEDLFERAIFPYLQ